MGEVFRYLAGLPAEKAKGVAEGLLQVLLPFRNGPPYRADTDPEVILATEVQKKLGVTFGEWNGLLFEAQSRLHPSPRPPSESSSSGKPPVDVENVAEVKELKDFVAKAGAKFVMIYTDTELDDLVRFARPLNLSKEEFLGIVQTGCRDLKPRSAEQLKDQIFNWKSVVTKQGHPFKFKDIDDFKRFRVRLVDLVGQCELDGKIKLPTKDIRIQGSSLRTPFAEDVDIAVCVTTTEYRDICAGRFQNHFTKLDKTVPETVDELKKISYEDMVAIAKKALQKTPCGYTLSGQKGAKLKSAANYILMGKFDGKSKDFMEPLFLLTEQMKTAFPELNIESVTVILVGGPFDLKPALTLEVVEKTLVKQDGNQ